MSLDYLKEKRSPFLSCGLSIMTFSQSVQYGSGEKSNFIIEKPEKTLPQPDDQGHPQQSYINHVESMYAWCDLTKWPFYSAVFPPRHIILILSWEMHHTNSTSGIVQKPDLYYSKFLRSSKPGKSKKLRKSRGA